MKPSELLRIARAKIAEPGTWIQNTLARNILDMKVDPPTPSAVKFCLVGAVYQTEGTDVRGETNCLVYLEQALPDGWYDLEFYNDSHTHQQVLDVYDRAIALAEQVEQYNTQEVPSA